MKRTLLAVLISSVALSLPAYAQTPATAQSGDELYVSMGCYQCHGYVGQGSPMSGPPLTPLRLGDDEVGRYVRAPRGAMPAYSQHMLPQDSLQAIIAYIRTMPVAKPAVKIPLLAKYASAARSSAVPAPKVAPAKTLALKAEDGGALYKANCAACHGDNRQGGVGPALVNESSKRTHAQIAELIKAPPAAMPRLFPDPLSAAQVDAIAAYLVKGN